MREISRERERGREFKRVCFDALGSISYETCMKYQKKFSFVLKKNHTILYTLNTSPFSPSKMAAEITTKREREEEEEEHTHAEERERERERRTRKRENDNF